MDKGTVLIVESNPEDLDALRGIVSAQGCIPIKATSGENALNLLHANPMFDVILLSAAILDVDCVEFCTRIKGEPKTAGIAIVLVTGPGCDADRVGAALSSGAFGCLSKPCDANCVAAWLNAGLSGAGSQSGVGDSPTASGSVPCDAEVLHQFSKLSHNVNNPLQALYATADLLAFTLPQGSKEAAQIEKIITYAQSAGELVAEAARAAKRQLGQ